MLTLPEHYNYAGAAAHRARVLGVSGSLRPTSKTSLALRAALTALETLGVAGEALELSELPLPLFSGYSYPEKETGALERLRDRVATHDLVLLASPEYHGTLSGSLKNALDHLPEGCLQGKVVGLIGVAGGSVSPIGTTTSLRSIVRALGGIAAPGELLVTHSKRVFDTQGNLTEPQLQARTVRFAEQLIALGAQLRSPLVPSNA
jgi:FMN reductase